MRNSWEADSFGLSGEDVFNWKKVMPTVNDHVQNYLINFFLDDLNLFWNEVKKVGNPKWRRLVESVFNLAFDRGLRQEISLSLPNGETRNAEPVYMLGRAAGIDWLKRKTGFKKDGDIFFAQPFQILRFDINGVFQANQFQQGEGGDYLINQVAAGLNDAIAGIKDLLDGVELIPSRYGGDEFVVFISGYILPDQVIQITNKIKESIKDKKAYFGENGEERNISIKKDEIEIIDPSQIADETKKQLFYLFLNRGIILSLNELNAEYERIKGREGSIEKYLQEENAQKQIYPPGVETLEQKIEYFINLHPELKVPFYLARFIDRKYGDLSRQENLLFFIENNLFDPLLNRITMNRQDLPEHFKEKQFKLIWSFEIKLKEINEHKSLGYVYADEVIEKAWVKIRKLLQDKFSDDWEKYITVGRFGGLIFIGLKNYFNDLADDDLKKIQNELKQIQLEHYGITHDIGFAQIIPEEISGTDDQVATNLKIEKTINTVFSDPDIDWYMKRASFLKNLPTNEINIFIDKLIRGELEIDESEIEDINTRVNLELLLSYFLNEKRGTIRRGNFVNVIADELKSDLSWLIEIFQKIENEKQNQSGYL